MLGDGRQRNRFFDENVPALEKKDLGQDFPNFSTSR
jgi:hypothetical protein